MSEGTKRNDNKLFNSLYKITVKFWDINNLELVCLACHNKEHPERSGGEKKVKTKRKVVKFYATRE